MFQEKIEKLREKINKCTIILIIILFLNGCATISPSPSPLPPLFSNNDCILRAFIKEDFSETEIYDCLFTFREKYPKGSILHFLFYIEKKYWRGKISDWYIQILKKRLIANYRYYYNHRGKMPLLKETPIQ